jgi:hypothetical protein
VGDPRVGAAALLATIALALGPATGSARACAACACGDSTLTAVGLEKPYKNRVRLALDERLGGHTAGAGDQAETAWTLRSTLIAMWSPIDRLTLSALLPLQSSWISSMGVPAQRFTGLGDAEVAARGVVWRNRGFSPSHLVSLLAGIKLPTGPRLLDGAGYPYPEDDQPGSGSFDPYAGASYAWFGSTVSTYASVSWRQTTEGRRGYRRGSLLGATAGAQLQPAQRVAFGLALDFRWALADSMPSLDGAGNAMRIDVPNSGGAALALSPSVMVAILDRWLVRAGLQVNVWDHLNGMQSDTWTAQLSTVVEIN